MPKLSMTLPSGVKIVLEGSEQEVLSAAAQLGVDPTQGGEYYYSESRGSWDKVSEMQGDHARNAFLKRLRGNQERYLERVKALKGLDFLAAMTNMSDETMAKDSTLVRLLFRLRELGGSNA